MSRAQLTSTDQQNSCGPVSPYVAGKNFAANGNFDIWQRGTSFSFNGSGGYTADRWYGYSNAATTFSQDTTTLAPGTRYSIKAVPTSTQPSLTQSIETANSIYYAGQTVTFSMYLAASANTAMTVLVQYSTSTDVSPIGSFTTITTGSPTATTTMTRYTFTAAIPSNAKTIQVSSYPSATTSNTIYWGGLQLELGSVATAFSRAGGTLQGELAACQRYYYRINNNPGGYGIYGTGFGTSSTNANVYVLYPVQLRQIATAIDYSTVSSTLEVFDGTTQFNASAISYNSNESWVNGATLNVTVSGMTNYRPVKGMFQGSSAGYIGFSAEL